MKSLASSLAVILLLAVAQAGAQETPKVIDLKVTGHGKPVLLIPGLACPGGIWDATVQHLQADHECHVVTIAGFGSQPAVKSEHLLADVRDQLIAYIRARKLEKPLLLGHSLGGVMALQIGITAPELPGRIIAVDSLPFVAAFLMPGVSNIESAKIGASAVRKMIESQTPEQFAKYQREISIPSMVTKPEDIPRVADLVSKSDPAATAQAMSELLTLDLRPDLGKIECPLLVLGALADKLPFAPQTAVEANYRGQYSNAKSPRFQFFDKAKHFIMIDDPAGFQAALAD